MAYETAGYLILTLTMQTAPAPPAGTHVYQPTELNREVRLHLEAGFARVWVQGEISNLARPASGHLYFSLKDDQAQIRCALFRGNVRGPVRPANGQQVIAAGRISLFEPRGDYQLIVDHLLDAGAGALQQAFEALKKKLDAEGLFAPERKRALPAFPRRIVLVTSPSGAAVRDILHVLGRRWPLARIRIYPTLVQGSDAPPAIVRALEAAGRHAFGELVIVARGGGSLEDLWAFNTEPVARAVAACPVPVISAVGHETDFTIADFVADVRAPTPSAAAELAVPDAREQRTRLDQLERRLGRHTGDRLDRRVQLLDHLERRLRSQHPQRRLHDFAQRLDRAQQRLWRATPARIEHHHGNLLQLHRRLRQNARHRIEQSQLRLTGLARALDSVSPLAVLGRGYAVIRGADGRALADADAFRPGLDINVLMHEFELDARVTSAPRPR